MKKELAFIKKEFSQYPNLKVRDIIYRGDAVDGVNTLKREHSIDLIAMGTKGASGLTKLLVGSVTTSVVRETGIPVLIIPEKEQYSPIHKIVFATDFSKETKQELLTPLKQIAQKSAAEIALLNVLSNKEEGKDFDAFKDAEIEKVISFEGVKTSVEIIEKVNDIDSTIEKYCKENDADLLTVVAHHNGFFDRLFHQSVSQELIFHAKLPILALDDSFKD